MYSGAMRRPVPIALALLAACPDDHAQHGRGDDADAADAEVGAEVGAPDDTDVDDTALPEVDDTAVPTGPERPSAIDWAIQSEAPEGVSVGYPSTLALADGGLVVAATFDGPVSFGGRELTSDDARYTHALFTRVTPDGEVAALTRLCDRCLQARTPLRELADGQVAFASFVDGDVVLAPGSAAEARFTAARELLVAVVTRDGELVRWARVARMPGYGSAEAIALGPDGGLVIAGSCQGLTLEGGPTFLEEEGWHYPGRAFLVGVDAALAPRFGEQLGGAAGSTIGLAHLDGDTLFTVGDFGGYPLGVASVFGVGQDAAVALPSVSSDDDPAMDIFVARWRLPGAGERRPRLVGVQRIAHYSNGPRPATWIRGAPGGGVELRVEGVEVIVADDGGHFRAPHPDRWRDAIVRVSPAGAASVVASQPAPLAPAPGGFVSLTSGWAGAVLAPSEDGPTFLVPADDVAAGLGWGGLLLATWDADARLVGAGLILERHARGHYALNAHALVPQADGSALVLLHGAAPVALVPDVGGARHLDRDLGFERLVVVRIRLAGP